ncbi:hypothetical protein QNH14_01440 [Apirhabdus apintestini]|nr:hypothetical protein QNH14_01440 [Enterobacteriaceae bacterium CA-0114]
MVEQTNANVAPEPTVETVSLTEHSLYPILIDYLSQEEGLLCRRIDEKRSSNNKGLGGNHWLYPDIVALEPLDKEWDDVVQNCVRHSEGRLTRLWSFEVKKRAQSQQCARMFLPGGQQFQLGAFRLSGGD